MSISAPLVTIAMPVYNAARTIAQTIVSIQQQTLTDWELLIIDDGSTDATLAVARSFDDPRITIIGESHNRGLPLRLNQTIDLSRGEYYARMDADDIAYPQRLARQLAFLQEQPNVDLLGCWILLFDSTGSVVGKRTPPTQLGRRPSLIRGVPIPHPTFFGRTAWFREHRYAPSLLYFQDQHLLLRTQGTSRFAVLPEILMGYRENQLTGKKQVQYRLSIFQATNVLVRDFGLARTAALLSVNTLKLGVDLVAVGTGLNYRILRHRAAPATEEEIRAWAKVWEQTNIAAQEHAKLHM